MLMAEEEVLEPVAAALAVARRKMVEMMVEARIFDLWLGTDLWYVGVGVVR